MDNFVIGMTHVIGILLVLTLTDVIESKDAVLFGTSWFIGGLFYLLLESLFRSAF